MLLSFNNKTDPGATSDTSVGRLGVLGGLGGERLLSLAWGGWLT